MTVLLVRDEEALRSAAALSVAIGSFSDPDELPGLAHLLEHMLFQGTEKYPGNSFDAFITKHGGFSNAETKSDSTTYTIEVPHEIFPEALHRFAQLFITPSLDFELSRREIGIIDAEFKRNMSNDLLRALRVDASISDASHPFHKFTTGNKESFLAGETRHRVNLRKMLKSCFDNNYQSQLMSLVIYGRETLDILQRFAEHEFTDVRRGEASLLVWPWNPYKEHHRFQLDIVPVSNIKQIFLKFPIPDPTSFYKTGVEKYLSYVLHYEGNGGLATILKKNGWVARFGAAMTVGGRGFGFFTIKADLTVRGWEFKDEIFQLIFQYLDWLRRIGLRKSLWKEIATLDYLQVQFQEKSNTWEFVSKLAINIQKYPMKDILVTGNLTTNFNRKYFDEILRLLIPENCRIMTVGLENASSAIYKEKYYGVAFHTKTIQDSRIAAFKRYNKSHKFCFPPKNKFIPTKLEIKCKKQERNGTPYLLCETALSRLWFLGIPSRSPKGVVKLEFYTLLPLLDPFYFVLNELFVDVINERGQECCRMATAAGLEISIISSLYGFEISVHGFTNKIWRLLVQILSLVSNFEMSDIQYRMILSKWRGNKEKIRYGEAYVFAMEVLSELLVSGMWKLEQLLSESKNVTYDWMFRYARLLLTQFKLHWLVVGNFREDEVSHFITLMEHQFKMLNPKGLPNHKIRREQEILLQTEYKDVVEFRDGFHNSSSVLVYFQANPVKDIRESLFIQIICQLLQEPCFEFFNIKLKLGYIAQVHLRQVSAAHGIFVLIQSDIVKPVTMEAYIMEFLHEWKESFKQLKNMGQGTLAEVLGIVHPPSCSLLAQAEDFWKEVTSSAFQFNRDQLQHEILKRHTVRELIEFMDDLFGTPEKAGGALRLHIIAQYENKKN